MGLGNDGLIMTINFATALSSGFLALFCGFWAWTQRKNLQHLALGLAPAILFLLHFDYAATSLFYAMARYGRVHGLFDLWAYTPGLLWLKVEGLLASFLTLVMFLKADLIPAKLHKPALTGYLLAFGVATPIIAFFLW